MSNGTIPRVELAATHFDWNIDGVVRELSQLRNDALIVRNRLDNPTVLPSRSTLAQLVDRFSTALFPNRLSARRFTRENVDYFVGQTLDLSCRELVDQVCVELAFADPSSSEPGKLVQRAIECVRAFAARLPSIRVLLDSDIEATFESDPAARSIDEVLICYPGIFAMLHHRIAHELYQLGLYWIARIISELAHSKTGIEIHPGARIGRAFFIDHGTGVVVGETSIIGEGVSVHHGVTLGATSRHHSKSEREAFACRFQRHPKVEDGVLINAGATLLGPITIGRGAIIGGNVCVTTNVPAGTRVTQAQSILDSFVEGAGI